MSTMRIAVIGCAHGEIADMYAAVAETEKVLLEREGPNAFRPVQLVICAGDFQACRNPADLLTMACPPKYRDMHTFHEFYSGKCQAPILTLFVGGNHEASSHLLELPYGGWVAPNIYYLGHSGCVQVNSLRIGGISGIYKEQDVLSGRYERVPLDNSSMRSCYHQKRHEARRLEMLATSPNQSVLDAFVSHDWPNSIACARTMDSPQVQQLLRRKAFFADEVRRNELGSPLLARLLHILQPRHWFSAHLHVKFGLEVPHMSPPEEESNPEEINLDEESTSSNKRPKQSSNTTKFLCLDKIVPGKDFLQILDLPCIDHHYQEEISSASETRSSQDQPGPETKAPSVALYYDPDWLAIIKATHTLTPVERRLRHQSQAEFPNCDLEPARAFVSAQFPNKESLRVPLNFSQTVDLNDDREPRVRRGNPQTDLFLTALGLEHIDRMTVPYVPPHTATQ